MIRFFREIRYDLMEKNKTGKYFKYAVGEIVLVVIGILIALQINNWNENRKQLIKQDFLFKQILLDAEADDIFFNSRLIYLSELDSTFIYIKRYGNNSNYDISNINTNGFGRVFTTSSLRFNSNVLDNNPDGYKELSAFDIKENLRAIKEKHQYITSAFLRLNKNLESQEVKLGQRYYKELRQNEATKSIKALQNIYNDEELQSIVDILRKYIVRAKRRTIELLELNEQLIKALTTELNKSD
jgi:hypothetical protein